jgi:glycosyltransferase involved in cell wall biosynthesis
MGAMLYTQNLAKAVGMYAAQECSSVTISMPDRFIDRALIKTCKQLADRVRIVPRSLLNPWRYDFVYPDYAGVRAPYRWGAWIPDLQERHLPELFSREDLEWRSQVCENAATAAPAVVFSSRMAQSDFLNLYPQAEPKCFILNFTSCPMPNWTEGDPLEVQARYGLPDRFFLVSNQFWKHKDHGTVMSALEALRGHGDAPTVVCTGALEDYRDPHYFPRLQARIATLGLEDRFRILGLIPRLDQLQLMRRCLAVIQPSLFEGWSTVVEDARALGKPMLLSDFPVHIEQAPPNARYFERGNAEQLAELMLNAWNTLNPGPDVPTEVAALAQSKELTLAYGKRFLEIARTVQ